MPEISKNELQSPELQEVMTEIPGGFIRWGVLLIFGTIITVFMMSWFIKYPEVVNASVTITTFNPPVSFIAGATGKIERLFVNNGDKVIENQPIALIENQAVFSDIIKASEFIESLGDSIIWQERVKGIHPPTDLELGEMQSSWLKFVLTFREFREYIFQSYLPEKNILLIKQIERQEEYIKELLFQKYLAEEDLQLSENSFKRDSLLFEKSNYSISITQLEKSKQTLLQKQVSFSALKSSIKNQEASVLKMRELLLDQSVQLNNDIHRYSADLDEGIQMFEVAKGIWSGKFLISSPVPGTVTFVNFWHINQAVKAGEAIAYLIPSAPEDIIVRAKIPLSGSGRVRSGNQVNVKLSGYPYLEYGFLQGIIETISLVPMEGFYIANISLKNGLLTSNKKEIKFLQEMDGSADIISGENRLFFKLINRPGIKP
jgi:biotin carboxyl carrier protein